MVLLVRILEKLIERRTRNSQTGNVIHILHKLLSVQSYKVKCNKITITAIKNFYLVVQVLLHLL